MSLALVKSYLHESVQTYQACVAALGVLGPALDLFVLIRAARSGDIDRHGELTTPEGVLYGYHIHGVGYSFTETASGREIHFDACIMENEQCIRFTIWSLLQYASGIGQDLTRETAQTDLQRPEALQLPLIHVTEGGFDFYCYPVSSGKR